MLPVESYSLSASLNSKYNYPVCAALLASFPAVAWGAVLPISFVLHTFPCVQMSSAHLGALR